MGFEMVIKSCKNTLICSPNNLGLTHFLNGFHTSRPYRIQQLDTSNFWSESKQLGSCFFHSGHPSFMVSSIMRLFVMSAVYIIDPDFGDYVENS